MGVKALAAAWAADNTGQGDGDDENEDPDDKNSRSAGLVVGRVEGDHHGRQVDDDDKPEEPASFADFPQSGGKFFRISWIIFVHCRAREHVFFFGSRIPQLLTGNKAKVSAVTGDTNDFLSRDQCRRECPPNGDRSQVEL